MWTFTIFLLLGIAEFGFLWMQWDKINTYRETGKDLAVISGVDKNRKYTAGVRIAARFLSLGKYIFFLLVPVLAVVNLIIAIILGTILSIIF